MDSFWSRTLFRRHGLLQRSEKEMCIRDRAMVQHKSEKISYKVEKYQYIPEEQQYIVEGMHEAIISKDTFEQVQELMKKRTRTPGFLSEVRKVNPVSYTHLARAGSRSIYGCNSRNDAFCGVTSLLSVYYALWS